MVHKQEISGPNGQPMALTLEASTARERIAARLDAIASRRAAALPAPSERPIPLERVGDVYSAVPAQPCPAAGSGNDARALAVTQTRRHSPAVPGRERYNGVQTDPIGAHLRTTKPAWPPTCSPRVDKREPRTKVSSEATKSYLRSTRRCHPVRSARAAEQKTQRIAIALTSGGCIYRYERLSVCQGVV